MYDLKLHGVSSIYSTTGLASVPRIKMMELIFHNSNFEYLYIIYNNNLKLKDLFRTLHPNQSHSQRY